MVHKLEHNGVAPIVIVISRAFKMKLSAVKGKVGNDFALGDCGEPSEILFFLIAKEYRACLRAPRGDRAVKRYFRLYFFAIKYYVVVLKVTRNSAIPYSYIALILCVEAVLDARADKVKIASAVGQSQLKRSLWLNGSADVDRRLGKEYYNELCAVLIV